MAIDFFQFMMNWILAGFLWNFIKTKLTERESPFAKAMAFIG